MNSKFSVYLFFSFLLVSAFGVAKAAKKPAKPALVAPVSKDALTGQHVTIIGQRTPLKPVKLTLDIGGKSLWVACDKGEYVSSTYKPAICKSPQCELAKSKNCGKCWDGPRPGCNNNTCSNNVYNTIERSAQSGELATDDLTLQSTDGRNPGRYVRIHNFLFSCGSLFLGEKLAKNVKGIAGLGRSDTSLPSLLSTALGIPKKYAICLSNSDGVVFFGDGPYIMLPGIDISERLTYTPLLVNPVSTAYPIIQDFPDKYLPSTEYFIGVESIKVNGEFVPVSKSLLQINSKGNGGTKISTVIPYTTLQTSIYNAVTKAFTEAISKVPRVKPVEPFTTCYNASTFGSTRLGPGVPPIELVLQNKAVWTIVGANSMVLVKNNVLCLGFVDGGKKPRTSIVIGGVQLQDNLLQFDLAASRLGFSSNLHGIRTTCSNFNFTMNA